MGRTIPEKSRSPKKSANASKIPTCSLSDAPAEAPEDDGLFYVVCAVMPWSSLKVDGPFIGLSGTAHRMIDVSNPVGFMPVFKTREDAETFKADAGNGPAARGEIMVMTRETKL